MFVISTKDAADHLFSFGVCSPIAAVPAKECDLIVLVRFTPGTLDMGNPLFLCYFEVHNGAESESIFGGRWIKILKCRLSNRTHCVLGATTQEPADKLLTNNGTVFDCDVKVECFTTLKVGHAISEEKSTYHMNHAG